MPDAHDTHPFDFAAHEAAAVSAYLKVMSFYADLSAISKQIVLEAIRRRALQVHSVEGRAKAPESFGKKASKPSASDPTTPKYPQPLEQITDLAAIRIISFFPRTLGEIDQLLRTEFVVIEQSNKGDELIEEERFGYKSVHYLVRMSEARVVLPEYARFANKIFEVQVRTILQHAWAEIEHDIQYKSATSIPRDIRRRFMALAGLLEIADREFQSIQDDDRALGDRAAQLVDLGQLDDLELHPRSLKAYLDKKLGPDGRVSEWSYDWAVRLLKRLGFTTLQQVDECIQGYNDDQISRVITGTRQGPVSRFEYMLLAGMGELFIQRHTFAAEPWYGETPRRHLTLLKNAGIEIRAYDPASTASQVESN